MEVQQILLTISNILLFLAFIVYIISILQKKTKPHRTTRIVLLIINGLAFASLFTQQNQTAIWLPGISFIMSIVIFFLTLKYGMGGWKKTDIICLCIALFGVVIWRITNNPLLALFSAVLADFTGYIPTLIKTYYHPETEYWGFFALGGLASLLNLFATEVWNFENVFYPFYLTSISAVMVFLILRTKYLTSQVY